MEAIMQSLAEKSVVKPTHEPDTTHTVHPPHARSHALCHRHWFRMLVVMINTHIRGRRRGREQEEDEERGLMQWQRASHAPRERQVGVANDEGDRDGDEDVGV